MNTQASGEAWTRLWQALGAHTVPGGLYNQLVRAYSEPQRRYHTLEHLRECLAYFEAAASLARRPDEVELAIWFHDAVYDPQRRDNEQRSADWARAAILAAGCAEDLAERVAGLVLATAKHEAPADDPDAQVLLDIDLAILGAGPVRYTEHEEQVRAEYAHVSEADWRAGRTRVLEGFLARPRLFATPPFHAALEEVARANIQASLAALRA